MSLEKNLKSYRLSMAEYNLACSLVGHPLQGVEWALFSALWSEHCSYKSSKVHLRKFSYRNTRTPDLDGENAGLVDLGMGEKIIFKMESHNHPSFIEPFHGAATGVGGILRDIFTMGARPIALADFLCFGDPSAPRMKELMRGVVKGISAYGNCVGVPTVTGKTHFAREYNKNILVNAMAVGLLTSEEPMALSKAQGRGNYVVYAGAKTGRDGVHGASMASEAFDNDLEKKKPNVQIGDPFYEKLLIEACLDVLKQKLVVAMQDMGAAGLTSSSFEMAHKGGLGLSLHLDQVPLREDNILPEEILLSESQERMLLIVKPEHYAQVQSVFKHWGLEAVKIGEILEQKNIEIFWRGEKICSIDPDLIVGNAPRYEREFLRQPTSQKLTMKESVLINKLQEQNYLLSKKSIYEQYDQRVGTRTERDASSDLAILRLPSGRRLGISLGCNPQFMAQNAQLGTLEAFVEPYLKLAAQGLDALAATDCLNFGNPERPQVMGQFVDAVEELAECSRVFDVPVISGNVSFYNETLGEQIIPTPALGLVGLGLADYALLEDKISECGQKVWLLFGPELHPQNKAQILEFAQFLKTNARKNRVSGQALLSCDGVLASLEKVLAPHLGLQLACELDQLECSRASVLFWGDLDGVALQIFKDFKIQFLGVTDSSQRFQGDQYSLARLPVREVLEVSL
ncbi:MAG: phosphoribosylformylglycinamidine synthase subunit PurL [Bdellovibrionia bacterium]